MCSLGSRVARPAAHRSPWRRGWRSEIRQQQLDRAGERPGAIEASMTSGLRASFRRSRIVRVGREQTLEVGDLAGRRQPDGTPRDVLVDRRSLRRMPYSILSIVRALPTADGTATPFRWVLTVTVRASATGERPVWPSSGTSPPSRDRARALATMSIASSPSLAATVELLGHRSAVGFSSGPKTSARRRSEHAVGRHPAEHLPASDLLGERLEADRVARLADLDTSRPPPSARRPASSPPSSVRKRWSPVARIERRP